MAHIPVLQSQVIAAFEDMQLENFFEGTVGAGGHAKEILKMHPEIKRYFACDRDPSALAIAKQVLQEWDQKIDWIYGPFSELSTYLKERKETSIDGFFIDIGVSSMQIDQAERGFSFRFDAPLDMRMDPSIEKSAEDLINTLKEEELARIFYEYGEEYRSRAAAKAIVKARRKKRISRTQELIDVLEPVLRKGKVHFATKVFQALRIAVNDELNQLKKGLEGATTALSEGGRIAVITFHSLEDRIVKWFLRENLSLKVITKKPMTASREEIRKNPRSRSAKLRVAEKVG